jgi:choline dehydrogenase-like flavoprotein
MPSNDIVDALIIGSGASGAAVAWSLAETRMKIVCLEQGDWIKNSDLPSHGRDWEARRYADFDISPNRRARPTDYPINDDNSPMKVANFNGVGGGTIMYTAHFPRMHPSDFRVRTLDGVADDWPIDYATLEPFFFRERPHDWRLRSRRRSSLPTETAADAAVAAWQDRHPLRPGDEPAGLALVAVGQRDRHRRI